MDYKYETVTSETVGWTAKSGPQITVTVKLVQEWIAESDWGQEREWRKGRLVLSYDADIDGVAQNTTGGVLTQRNKPPMVASLGNIGITTETLPIVRGAEDRVMAHPAWIAMQNRVADRDRAEAEYEMHQQRMADIMRTQG